MRVSDLIERLQDLDPDAEVKLAFQPSWPFQYSVGELVEVDVNEVRWGVEYTNEEGETELEFPQVEEDHDEARDLASKLRTMGFEKVEVVGKPDTHVDFMPEAMVEQYLEDTPQMAVYLGEGGQDCYLPHAAKKALDW